MHPYLVHGIIDLVHPFISKQYLTYSNTSIFHLYISHFYPLGFSTSPWIPSFSQLTWEESEASKSSPRAMMTSGAMYCKVPMNLLAWSGDDGFPPPVAVFWHALNMRF